MEPQSVARAMAQALRSQLGRLARTHLGADQDHLEAHLQARKRKPCHTCLPLATRGQAALAILASAVWLCVCVP
jgi:hypothetical protein